MESDFTPGGDILVAEGEIDSEVDCPSPINELFMQPYLPEGAYDIELSNVDLDAWVKLSYSGADVTSTLKVRVSEEKAEAAA